jgi:hypothetical protein
LGAEADFRVVDGEMRDATLSAISSEIRFFYQ